MDAGMEGGNRSNAGSFWHQVRKKPELWADKSISCIFRLALAMNTFIRKK